MGRIFVMNKNRITILGLLIEKPMYGYEIKGEIKKRGMDHWAKISLPSIYNVLNRLEEEGLIKVEKEKVGKMPERNIYHITEEGKIELTFQVEKSVVQFSGPDYPLMLGVYFIHNLEKDRAINAFEKRLTSLNEILNHFKKEGDVDRELSKPPHIPLMSEFGYDCYIAEKKFIHSILKILQSK